MLTCGKCHHEVKRDWKCKCTIIPSVNDVKIAELQPFITQLNGWGNFLNFIKSTLHKIDERPAPTRIEIELPETFEPNLDQAMKVHILRVLHLHEGNKTHAAAALGISVKTIYNKLESWGMLEETLRLEQ